jgi:DNA (cytosine-5)-methyltransferase 1
MTDKLVFVSLFAGCGGLSLGLLNAGWKGYFAIEKSKDAFETFKYNLIDGNPDRPKTVSIFEAWPDWLDIKEWDISEFLNEHLAHLSDIPSRIHLLAGGPPCQGFSMAGKRNGGDPRNLLFREYLRTASILEPDIVLVENVQGMGIPFRSGNESEEKSYADHLREELENLTPKGYFVRQELISADDYGVPQFRPRLLTLGFSMGLFKTPPDPFLALKDARKSFLKSKGLSATGPVTVHQALSDIASCLETQSCDDKNSPPGFDEIVYRRHPGSLTSYQQMLRYGLPDNYQPNSLRLVRHRRNTIERFRHIQKECRKGVQLSGHERKTLQTKGIYVSRKHVIVPLSGDQPSHTLTTIPDDLLHYKEPRVHTVRESARIQSFPDWFAFKGKYTTGGERRKSECPRYTQVGNAVPPLLAEVIGIVLINILKRGLKS